jgi:hypothetical protein
MYPLTCHAGFNVPARAGKFDIVGFTATAEDATKDTEVVIIDDPNIKPSGQAGFLLDLADVNPPTTVKHIIAREKIYAGDWVVKEGDAGSYSATIKWFPAESIKTRHGTSLAFNNIKQGSFCLYVR